MTFNRRVFFSLFFRPSFQPTSVSIRVLETFSGNQAPSAILVNHADESNRNSFAQWLRANPRASIRVRDRSGQVAGATIFRVRKCFGRGLILLDDRVQVRDGDVLTIIAQR
jgi:hypothetical protein